MPLRREPWLAAGWKNILGISRNAFSATSRRTGRCFTTARNIHAPYNQSAL